MSRGKRGHLCWLSVVECVPNVMLIAQMNRGFSAWSSWASCSLVFLRLIGRVLASAGYIEKGSGWKNWFLMKQKQTGSSVSLIATQIKPRKTRVCVEVHVGWVLGGNSYFAFSTEETILALRVLPSIGWCFSSLAMNRRHQKVSCCSRFCLSRIWTKTWQRFYFQVLIIVDCMANPSSSLDGVTGCWLM